MIFSMEAFWKWIVLFKYFWHENILMPVLHITYTGLLFVIMLWHSQNGRSTKCHLLILQFNPVTTGCLRLERQSPIPLVILTLRLLTRKDDTYEDDRFVKIMDSSTTRRTNLMACFLFSSSVCGNLWWSFVTEVNGKKGELLKHNNWGKYCGLETW